MKKVIAIDGTAGAGKGTLAKLLAEKIGFMHVDTGALYRAATVLILNQNINPENEKEVAKALKSAKIEIKSIDNKAHYILNNKDLTNNNILRSTAVNTTVSTISKYKKLRKYIRKLQRKIAKRSNIVMEGRDITTVVFPRAWIKFYIDAPIEIRAQRREKELKAQNNEITNEEVKQMINKRDRDDIERKNSPLICPPDAYEIDNTGTIEEAIEKMLDIIKTHNK